MSYKFLAVLLLIAHFVGDYYLQPQKLARAKEQKLKWLLLHCAIYGAATLLLVCIPFIAFPQAWWILLVPASHAMIDISKDFLLKTKRLSGRRIEDMDARSSFITKRDRIVFFLDQIAHIVIIAVFSLFFTRLGGNQASASANWIFKQFDALGVDLTWVQFLKLSCLALFLCKPCSIIVRNVLARPDAPKDEPKAGRVIGILERCFTGLFLLLGQWSALGFVIAAKTLARYNDITKEKNFAEQYLIGTMTSILLTVLAVLIYKQI